MKNKGFTLIESLWFFMMIILIVHYVCVLTTVLDTKVNIDNHDKVYEKAYE